MLLLISVVGNKLKKVPLFNHIFELLTFTQWTGVSDCFCGMECESLNMPKDAEHKLTKKE